MKQWLIAATLAGVSASAFAQGTVNFNNLTINPSVYTNKGGVSGLAKDGSFTVALYWAAGSGTGVIDPIANSPILKGLGSGQGNGNFSVGTATTGGATAPGTAAEFEVVGWTGSAASYAAALAGGAYVGVGTPFQNPTGGAGSPPGLPQDMTGWQGNLVLSPVPEPATMAIGGLGAAALLLFRRRK